MSTVPPPRPDALGYLHPASEADVARLLATSTLPVRVRGAAHSVPGAIHSDAWLRGDKRGAVELVLEHLRTVELDPVTFEVTVGAGVRFGYDPLDVHARDPEEDGLLPFLERHGRALVNLGGITHQTVVGFLATGSAGGSARHDLHADVVALRLVDAKGEVHEFRHGDEGFDATLVHLGLLGVVTSVTLRTHPRFDLVGSERVLPETGGEVDLLAEGPTGLAAFLASTPYARVLWWPQRGVEKIVVWAARPATAEDPPGPAWRPMPPVFGSTLPMQAAAGASLFALGNWRDLVGPAVARRVATALAPVRPVVYGAFLGPAARTFRGSWHTTLPLDREMSDTLVPTTFTELWIPLAHAAEALRRLRAWFDTGGDAAAGRFAIEL
jgi:FAD/FMN-containing dehydrogenase